LIVLSVITLVSIICFIGISYAWIYQTLRGNKTYSLKVQGYGLKLNDTSTSSNIKIENSTPVSDTQGKTTSAYTFSLINEESSQTGYILYLDDVSINDEINRMKDTNIKYQLIEDGNEKVGLVSELGTHPFRILTNGVINGKSTKTYSLRFWIKETAEISANQIFSVSIRVIATSKEAISDGKLVFGETIITSDSGITSMTTDQLQTYVDKALGNKIEIELNKQAEEYEERLVEQATELQKKITEAKTQGLNEAHPVGSIYISETNTNPSTLFGGTWVSYGQGRTLVGVGSGNDGTTSKSFTVGSTGGEYNHLLTIAEMPTHTHTQNPHEHGTNLWFYGYEGWPTETVTKSYVQKYNFGHIVNGSMQAVTGHVTLGPAGIAWKTTATNQNTGGSSSHNNVQPYITVYMWKRTK